MIRRNELVTDKIEDERSEASLRPTSAKTLTIGERPQSWGDHQT